MRTRAAALAAATLLAGATAHATAAPPSKPKPTTGSYAVVIPVPYPMEGASAHCTEGYDSLTRNTTKLALPAHKAKLDVVVSGFAGDWVVEIFDDKGRVLATGASLDLTSGSRQATYKKKKAVKETVTVAVCNFGGTPQGQVKWTFTPS